MNIRSQCFEISLHVLFCKFYCNATYFLQLDKPSRNKNRMASSWWFTEHMKPMFRNITSSLVWILTSFSVRTVMPLMFFIYINHQEKIKLLDPVSKWYVTNSACHSNISMYILLFLCEHYSYCANITLFVFYSVCAYFTLVYILLVYSLFFMCILLLSCIFYSSSVSFTLLSHLFSFHSH